MTSLAKKITHSLLYVLLPIALTGLMGCSGDSVEGGQELLSCPLPSIPDAAGTSCVAPPAIVCVAPLFPNELNNDCISGYNPNEPDPSVFPGANEAILFYNRADKGATNEPGDPSYDGYTLHTWNNSQCDSYASPYDESNWGVTHLPTGIDANYGVYWRIPLKENYSDCGNFIIHHGTDDAGKETNDNKMILNQDDETFARMNWFISGQQSAFEFPISTLGPQPLSIENVAAHWIDTNTFVWNLEGEDLDKLSHVNLHHSITAGIEADLDDNLNGAAIVLTQVDQTTEQQDKYPLTANWLAFSIDSEVNNVKSIVKNELVLAAYDVDGNAYKATHVQAAKILDDLFTSGEADADEAVLGVVYSGDTITANLWAPTAQNVTLNVYDANKDLVSANQMTEDPATGIWSFAGTSSFDRQFFRYELTLYHSQNNAIETIESTDPYSVSLSTNGYYSQFVNLADADLKPEGWDGHAVPVITDPEDAVIYEGHVRDFSAHDESTSEVNRGKYLAFTETETVPMMHLADLVANGLTHFHMLPVNDIATVNEDPASIVDITDTVGDLCALNESASVCGVEDDSATLLSVLEGYQSFSADAQALVNSMRGYDSFNWGYDPKHFNVPDGIYSSNPEGVARIIELRSMIKSLHDIGLRVNIDVVYNHTSSGGLWDNSVLDKVVPGYYQSLDLETGGILNETCCSDTALEHRMMDKFMSDSVVQWASQYAVDGFRFDIMSHGSKVQMLAARDAVRTVDDDTYFYGEGWPRNDRGFVAANQFNMAGTEISTFNDRIRDAIRGELPKDDEQGNPKQDAALFSGTDDDRAKNQLDILRLGMAGTLADYVLKSYTGAANVGSDFAPSAYALDPADVINYVSKHDDPSLWDQLQFNLPFETMLEDRVRAHNIAMAIPLMSQGVPFLQMGGDFIRSKSLDRNSYDSGDWFNRVDFTMASNNWNIGLPLASYNQDRWYTDPDKAWKLSISALSNSPFTQIQPTDSEFASSIFNEFLSIRRDSKLFRLTTSEDVIARVGFHNIGTAQSQGLVVMSIDDGIGLTDLDPQNDAIVVMVNGSGTEQSHTISTATGFVLHASQVASADSRVGGASFSEGTGEGTFTVPAKTMAVFVKPQGMAQGEGLSAFATSGSIPYGDEIVYIKGSMNGWSNDDPMTYIGDGIYRVSLTLTTAGAPYEFKFADTNWTNVNYGSDSGLVTENEDKVLSFNAGNLSFNPSVDATYFFEIDANDPDAPIINVRNEESYSGMSIFLKGIDGIWDNSREIVHIGGGIYKIIVDVTNAGEQNFKIANADWSYELTSGDGDFTVVEDESKLLGPGAGMGNLIFQVDNIGEYTFLLNASHKTERTISVHQTQMYGTETIYIKGSFNGWANDQPMVYQGDSTYTFERMLTAGDYEFKFADADWTAINYGADGDDQGILIGESKLLFYNAANIQLTVPTDGTYRFTVRGPNEEEPTMLVEAL